MYERSEFQVLPRRLACPCGARRQAAGAYITDKYKNTETNYPELAKLSNKERVKFDVRHCALHSVKLAGKLAAISEDADHGESLDTEKVKKLAVKELVISLKRNQNGC